jgi:hypothetical protein
MILRGAFQVLALKLQEAVDTALGANDVRTRLGDCIRSHFRGTGTWGYYLDHFGDEESGDVIYSSESEVKRATYSIEAPAGGAAAKCAIDFEGSVCVVPRTIYELDAEEADHFARMEESLKGEKLYTALPLYERYISQSERDDAAADDFAGKGRSFPILKAGDVTAAVHAMGRAGTGNLEAKKLKARIVAIAKRKGWEKQLPKSWRSATSSSEADPTPPAPGTLALREACAFAADIRIAEALNPSRKIKLIAPGKGSTAYYTEAALIKAAADKVFKAGTPMRIDHPTAKQEAERPEGSVKDWGAVLARDAEWIGDHPEGPGLYSEVKPFSDSATFLEERAPYAGVSIRANGFAVMEGGKPVLREGVPVLKEFTTAEGVDMVTRAGAGGMFLSEAAIPAAIPTNEGGASEMDPAQLTALQESVRTQTALNARLLERAIRGDARELAQAILIPLTLHEAAKAEVVSSVLRGTIPTKEGDLDREAFTALVNAEAKRIGDLAAAIAGSGRVAGMGTGVQTPPVDPTVAAREAETRKQSRELRITEATRSFVALGMPEDAAKRAALRDEQEAA